MAQITLEDLETLDYCFLGEPFNSGTSKLSLDESMMSMDFAFNGEPFIGNEHEVAATGHKNLLLMGVG